MQDLEYWMWESSIMHKMWGVGGGHCGVPWRNTEFLKISEHIFHVNDCIEPIMMFLFLSLSLSLSNARVSGLGEIFVQQKFLAVQ